MECTNEENKTRNTKNTKVNTLWGSDEGRLHYDLIWFNRIIFLFNKTSKRYKIHC